MTSGQFVLHTLISDFIGQVDKKVDNLLNDQFENYSSLTKESLSKSLQRGEDPQFDQLLCSLGCVAEYCLPSLLDTLFRWYNHQMPDKKYLSESTQTEKMLKLEPKYKGDTKQSNDFGKDRFREFAVEFVFCLVLIEILKQIPVHPLPDNQIRGIISKAFESFHASALAKDVDIEICIIADLYAEVIGVLAQTKFLAVHQKVMHELLKYKEASGNTLIALIMGMKYFRVKMYPVEDFEASFRFMQELATYSLDLKNREVKNALAGMFVEVLVPVAAAVKTEVNVPVLREFVDSLYPTSLELSKRAKNKPAIFPLVTCLLCVSQKTFFLNNWHIFLDICLSTLKNRDPRLSRVALESLYRLLWVYVVRIKCESNTTTQARLQSIVKNLFPSGSRSVVPKDMPLNIFVKIIQFIALERLDYAMRDIILDLLVTSSTKSVKTLSLYPERMNIGLRAFLVITDSLQQKDGAPPMPSTAKVMPSGNTIRAKKTFLNKTLTDDDARSIGVLHYLRQLQRSLGGILSSLDNQVGIKMLQTNFQIANKFPKDLITGEQKPKIELFRTCVAALPRLMPQGISRTELLDMLCRLTIHIDDDLRSRAIVALQAFIIDFPAQSEEVVACYLSFVQSHVSDIHQELLINALKITVSLLSIWKTSINGTEGSKNIKNQLSKKRASEVRSPSSPVSSPSHCSYSSIISRIEGFALIYLCSPKNHCRKLACSVLKEVRGLAGILNYGKPEDPLCLDCLDQLCPKVSMEVIEKENYFQNMERSEVEAILSIGYKKDLLSLVELSTNWTENSGLHPWIYFMIRFIDASGLSRLCSNALSYSWTDAYARLSQIQRYIEPFITAGSKKVTSVPLVNAEYILTLWTHYLIFLCRSALSSKSVKHRHNHESAVPAGTPDWKVKLIRDGKRSDAVPSNLFRKAVEVIRSDSFPASYKESAVVSMGYTSTAAFHDLLTELQHVIHEAGESKKQENVRRRRKREHLRIYLIKLFANLATHEVLSRGIYKQVEKLDGSKKIPKEAIQEYIDETRSILEVLDKSEFTLITSFSSQQLNASSSFGGLMTSNHNSHSVKDEMKLNFADLVIHLIKYYPGSSRPNLFPSSTKRSLYNLYKSWYDKCPKDFEKCSGNLQRNYCHKMLSARCSVMCCGPIFDEYSLGKDGYIYEYLEFLLSSADNCIRQLGRESVVLLLHFNPNLSNYRAWIFEKCYTATDVVAKACFLGVVSTYSHDSFNDNIITLLTLALLNITDHDQEISQAAVHLLSTLLLKYFNKSMKERTSTSLCDSTFPEKNSVTSNCSDSFLKDADDLAKRHPELTHSILSEVFMRFPGANAVRQRRLLKAIHPWLKNVELIPVADHNPKHNENGFDHGSPDLPPKRWGSAKGSLYVLNNIMYLTTYYHHILEVEIQACWCVLCSTWRDNLLACLQYLTALYSVKSQEFLRNAIRLSVMYMSKSHGDRVLSVLLEQCVQSKPVDVTIEKDTNEPQYKIVTHYSSGDLESPTNKLNVPVLSKESSSGGSNAISKDINSSCDREKISKSKANHSFLPSVAMRRSTPVSYPASHRLSLQIPMKSNAKIQRQSMIGSSSNIDQTHAVPSIKLSSSMMSLTKEFTDTEISSDDSDFMRFNTVSPSRPNVSIPKPFESDVLSKKMYTSSSPKEMHSSCSMVRPELDAATGNMEKSQTNHITNSNVAKLVEWVSDYCNEPKPLPILPPSWHLPLRKLICFEKVDGLMYSSISCIFLSQAVISQTLEINWPNHLPVITLSLLLNMDEINVKEVTFFCRRLLVHLLLTVAKERVPQEFIGPILSYAFESPVDALGVQSYPLRRPIEMDIHKSTVLERTMSNSGLISNEVVEDSVKRILTELICGRDALWEFENVSPKATALMSTDKLSAFAQAFTEIVESCVPTIGFRERLANEAIKLSVSTACVHHSCRLLQVFRSLQLPMSTSVFSKLVHCLVSRLAYGSDMDMQSHVIEILLTLIHDCDVGFDCDSPSKVTYNNDVFCTDNFNSQGIASRIQSDKDQRKQRSPTVGCVPTFPQGSFTSRTLDLSVNSLSSIRQDSHNNERADLRKRGRKIHAHRRSGSVTLSKKMTVDLLNSAASQGSFHAGSISVPELRTGFCAISSVNESRDSSTAECGEADVLMSELSKGEPATRSTLTNDDAGDSVAPIQAKGGCTGEERNATFAQMFWISIATLESDYEHEFTLALQLLDKVLLHLPLHCSESRSRIVQCLMQMQWHPFPGIQSILLKGLTSVATYISTFRLLSSLTEFSHLHLISGDSADGDGFAMNVVSVLPNLLESFSDPDLNCSCAAKRIAEVCVRRFPHEKKLQSLAHVMSLYSCHTYEQSSDMWISVVVKYIHETFPQCIHEHLDFLLLILDRGPGSMHLSCLRIVYSFLFLSEILLSSEQSDVIFHQNMLKTISKFVNNSKLWKDALKILKLAVSRSSAITTPAGHNSQLTSIAFTSDSDRIALPGRTLTFRYNISETPVIGRRQLGDWHTDAGCVKPLDSDSPYIHSNVTSSLTSNWKKPLSQKRTYERMSCVAKICGKHLVVTSDVVSPFHGTDEYPAVQNNEAGTQDGSDNIDSAEGNSVFGDEKDADKKELNDAVDDIVVLRNFDFLDELDENDNGFTTGYHKSNEMNHETEEDPDTYNLTPFLNRDSMHETEHPQSEDYSDLSDVGEQEVTSEITGILSQSWNGSNNVLKEVGHNKFCSSPATISLIHKSDVMPRSLTESIDTSEPTGRYSLLKTRLTRSENHLNRMKPSSNGSLKSLLDIRTNELDDSTVSDSSSSPNDSDPEEMTRFSINSTDDSQQDQFSNENHTDLLSSLKDLTTPAPPMSESADYILRTELSAEESDIPIVKPPPVANDITSNLSTVPVRLPAAEYSSSPRLSTKLEQNIHIRQDLPMSDSITNEHSLYKSWKLHMVSSTMSDSTYVAKTFDLFPPLFKALCVDFSSFSKKGCTLLGGQLSKIAEHFSSMVEQLPFQIKCPRCLASKSVIDPIVGAMSKVIQELNEHLETYISKRKYAMECIETIKDIGSLGHSSKSRGMGYKQLELCRVLYGLHYQLLLLLKCFNSLITLLASHSMENGKNLTRQMEIIEKKILTIAKTFHAHRDKQDYDMLLEFKSQNVEEAEKTLAMSISKEHFHLAIRQLHLLRQLWPPENFGYADEPTGDFLVKTYFNHLEHQSDEKIFAILGSEEASHEVCEKLMEVNGQIQQSLNSLALNAGDINKMPPIVKKTHF